MSSQSHPQSILFVCWGNIMRSAFAEFAFRRQLTELGQPDAVRVASAGVRAIPGMAAEENAARVAAQLGVPLDGHSAQPTTRALLARFDEVYLMDHLNHRILSKESPEAKHKIFYLSSVLPGDGPVEIGDPYCEGDATIRATFERISRCTLQLAERAAGAKLRAR
jgi:protein-tyrosine phosphatase